MKFYQRLDFQLGIIFILIFSSVITFTGVLNQVKVQIWLYSENPELKKQLTSTRHLFDELAASQNESALIANFQSTIAANASIIKRSKFLYLIADPKLNVVVDNSEQYTQIELVRPEPLGENFSVVVSNDYDYDESFLTFTEVPALPLKIALDKSYFLLVVPNPIDVEIPTVAQVVIKNFTEHFKIFAWYYFFIIIGIIAFLRFRLRHLRVLEQSAKELTGGKIPELIKLKTSGNDEVGQLVIAFNSAIQRLNDNEATRKRIIADISHELRTPLTNISGRIEAFDDGIIDDPKALIKFTSQQISGLIDIVEDMDVLVSIDSGMFLLEKKNVEITQVIKALLSTYNVNGSIDWEVDGSAMHLAIDVSRFRQIINNLLDNATKAKPSGLCILVKVSSTSKMNVICFEDNGPGVPVDQLPRLFDRLYRVDDSRNNNTGGSGLGLAIVKDLVEAHGGSIECYINEKGGLGTKIVFFK